MFNEIDRWVHESFDAISSHGMPDFAKITCSYPILTDATSKQLFTGLVFTSKLLSIVIPNYCKAKKWETIGMILMINFSSPFCELIIVYRKHEIYISCLVTYLQLLGTQYG